MKKLTILVDMDDTIEDLLTAWVASLNGMFNRNVDRNEVKSWDIGIAFPGIPKALLYQPLHSDEFWDNVRPKEDAPDYLKCLMDDGHNVYIVTSSYYDGLKAKMEKALFRYFPYIKWEQVILAHDKSQIVGDVLIDDGPHNHSADRKLGILIDMPHNQDAVLLPNMVRVSNLEQAYAEITKIVV